MELKELLQKQQEINQEIDAETADSDDLIDDSIIQLVSFTLDDVEYGIDILSVHEILRLLDLTRLPNTPTYIKGVLNLRGNVLPVVDVRMRFGFPPVEPTDLTRIIVIQIGEKQVGLLVDNVYQVVRVGSSSVDSPTELLEGVTEKYILGIGRLKDRLIVILNLTDDLFLEEEDQVSLFQGT